MPGPDPTFSERGLNRRHLRGAMEGTSSGAGSLRKHLARSGAKTPSVSTPREVWDAELPTRGTSAVSLQRHYGPASTALQTRSPSAQQGPVEGTPGDRGGAARPPRGSLPSAAADPRPGWPHQRPSRTASERGGWKQEETVIPDPTMTPNGQLMGGRRAGLRPPEGDRLCSQ